MTSLTELTIEEILEEGRGDRMLKQEKNVNLDDRNRLHSRAEAAPPSWRNQYELMTGKDYLPSNTKPGLQTRANGGIC